MKNSIGSLAALAAFAAPALVQATPAEFDTRAAEFTTVAKQGDQAALTTIQHYNRLMKDATLRLARLNLRPSPGELARLRSEGAIPAGDAST